MKKGMWSPGVEMIILLLFLAMVILVLQYFQRTVFLVGVFEIDDKVESHKCTSALLQIVRNEYIRYGNTSPKSVQNLLKFLNITIKNDSFYPSANYLSKLSKERMKFDASFSSYFINPDTGEKIVSGAGEGYITQQQYQFVPFITVLPQTISLKCKIPVYGPETTGEVSMLKSVRR